jgi:MHS family alpha-ketoglutarate permease-like MFS transporter
MIAIVALCLVVYFTLPETGSRGGRATVAPADPEVLKGEHLLAETPHSGIQAHNSKP